jgi:hypothetical protein
VPIDPSKYPADWKKISRRIRFERAGKRCEWCGAHNLQPHPKTGSKVVLTVAHLKNPDPFDCRLDNLAALCRLCHARYDGVRKRGIFSLPGQLWFPGFREQLEAGE